VKMIVVNCEQGSEEWLAIRRGVITASEFSQVMTPKMLKRAKTDYIYKLLAEFKGLAGDNFSSAAMDRGTNLEPVARELYAFREDVDPEQVGFIFLNESRLVGCSPDSLIGDDGGLEIKCPEAKAHIHYMMDDAVPDEYRSQVFGCLWLTGRSWWDFMSYHPKLPPLVTRVTNEDEGYKKWAECFEKILAEFIADYESMKEQLLAA